MVKRIYLDFASATPVSKGVVRLIAHTNQKLFGNPSSAHEEGRRSKEAMQNARVNIARSLSVKPPELVFTSGGTESNNIAIRGVVEGVRAHGVPYKKMHVITSSIEHSSVIETCRKLENLGVSVTYVRPTSDGYVTADGVLSKVRKNTVLISLAHVNSEIGTVAPVTEIGSKLQTYRSKNLSLFARKIPEASLPLFHVDAAQSPLYLECGPHVLHADLVSYDAQKVMGPKGSGVLYRDFSVPIASIFGGGTQEKSIRPGTENVAAIVGAGEAFKEASQDRKARAERVQALRDFLISEIHNRVPEAELVGSQKRRIANNAMFALKGVDGDYLTVLMDRDGVAVSPRSACVGVGGDISHVVKEVTRDAEKAKGTIRFSLGPNTTRSEIARAVKIFVKNYSLARGKNKIVD